MNPVVEYCVYHDILLRVPIYVQNVDSLVETP